MRARRGDPAGVLYEDGTGGRAMRVTVLAGLAVGLWAQGGLAQDWVTPDACALQPVADLSTALPVEGRAEVEAAAAKVANGVGRLWQVTAPDGRVSWIWGTFHSSDRLLTAMPPELADRLAQAAVLVIEADPFPGSRSAVEGRTLQAGMWIAASDGAYDKAWLTGPLRDWTEARVWSLTQQEGAMGQLTDAGLAYLLLDDPCEDYTAGLRPPQDLRLALAAYEAGIPVAGLERWDAFLNDLGGPDSADVAKALAKVYAAYLSPDGFREGREQAAALYLRGRLAEIEEWNRLFLHQTLGDGAEATATLADRYMRVERSARFVKAMKVHLDHGEALIAIGASHLPGNDGVLSLLAAEGYRVERIPTAGEDR